MKTKRRAALKDKIKQVDQQIEKLKEQLKKLEQIAAKLEHLMASMMKAFGSNRDKTNKWLIGFGHSDQPGRLRSIRDSIKQALPVQTAARKDSLIG